MKKPCCLVPAHNYIYKYIIGRANTYKVISPLPGELRHLLLGNLRRGRGGASLSRVRSCARRPTGTTLRRCASKFVYGRRAISAGEAPPTPHGGFHSGRQKTWARAPMPITRARAAFHHQKTSDPGCSDCSPSQMARTAPRQEGHTAMR